MNRVLTVMKCVAKHFTTNDRQKLIKDLKARLLRFDSPPELISVSVNTLSKVGFGKFYMLCLHLFHVFQWLICLQLLQFLIKLSAVYFTLCLSSDKLPWNSDQLIQKISLRRFRPLTSGLGVWHQVTTPCHLNHMTQGLQSSWQPRYSKIKPEHCSEPYLLQNCLTKLSTWKCSLMFCFLLNKVWSIFRAGLPIWYTCSYVYLDWVMSLYISAV